MILTVDLQWAGITLQGLNQDIFTIIQLYRRGTERLANLPQVTQLRKSRVKIQTQVMIWKPIMLYNIKDNCFSNQNNKILFFERIN